MGILFTALVGLAVIACFISPVWGMCAYVAVIIIRPNELFDGVLVPSIPIMIVVMCVAYLVHLGRALPRPGEQGLRSVPLMVAMVLLLALHFIVFPSGFGLVDWILSEAAPTLLLLFFMTRHMSTPGRVQAAFTTTMGSAAFLGLDALHVHFFLKGEPYEAESPEGAIYTTYGAEWDKYHLVGGRLQGRRSTIWSNPNDLGMTLNWAMTGCLFYMRRKGSKILRLAALALFCVMGMALFLTGSRGGQLQLGITLWMVFVGGRRKVLGMFLLVMALVGALVVLPRLSPERSDAAASKDERTELVKAGLRLFIYRPVTGVGFLRFPEMNDFKSLFPHNVYIQALAETGLIGAGIFFAMIFFLRKETRRGVKLFEAGVDPDRANLAACLGALQLSYTVFLLFSNQFMRYTFSLIMTQAMALSLAALRQAETVGAGVEQEKTEAERKDLQEGGGRAGGEDPPPGAILGRAEVIALPPEGTPAMPGGAGPGEVRYVFDPRRPQGGVQQRLVPDGSEIDDDDEDGDDGGGPVGGGPLRLPPGPRGS